MKSLDEAVVIRGFSGLLPRFAESLKRFVNSVRLSPRAGAEVQGSASEDQRSVDTCLTPTDSDTCWVSLRFIMKLRSKNESL